jgi:hypothetical protein
MKLGKMCSSRQQIVYPEQKWNIDPQAWGALAKDGRMKNVVALETESIKEEEKKKTKK